MFVGYFTERPYQDEGSAFFGPGQEMTDLEPSNALYNPEIGRALYHRYLDEKVYAEQMGFDGLMLNEHHSTPFTLGAVMNVEAAILARITERAKIVLLGNVLPIWDDPLWLAEELAEIDVISGGRLITGWVRGTGRESVTHNSPSPYNWERYQEAHDFIIKAWTTPGPFRWEGEHYHYRYVNPWPRPYQSPHPPIWIPGVISKNTVAWAARHRYPYIMLATELEPTKQTFAYYQECAREAGYEAGTQHLGYLWKVHVDETEELAEATARKYLQGPANPFIEGNQGKVRAHLQALPGLTSRKELLPTVSTFAGFARGRGAAPSPALAKAKEQHETGGDPDFDSRGTLDEQIRNYSIVTGTPKTVIPKIRHVLEQIRPGSVFFWDGDGAMNHDDAMRSLRLMGEEVIPALREMAKELDLPGPFDVDPATNQPLAANPVS